MRMYVMLSVSCECIYVCMYVCIYVCMCICMLPMCVCMNVCMYVCMHACIYVLGVYVAAPIIGVPQAAVCGYHRLYESPNIAFVLLCVSTYPTLRSKTRPHAEGLWFWGAAAQ